MRRTAFVVAGAAACLLAVAACAGTASGTAPSSAPEPSMAAASPAPSAAAATAQRSDLPAEWPIAVPAYPQGQLVAVTVSDDGTLLNATFGDATPMEDAFAAMDAALHAAGYRTTAEAGGADMLVRTPEQISQDYSGPGFDVNVVVAPGSDQSLVMVNATRTGA